MRLYYGGLVVHQSHSDEGVIEVVDLGDTRSLHFGTSPRQSTMSLSTPYTLELTYTHGMMASLLLKPNPRRVLVIGLGGGSLVKFVLHHFPTCDVDAVEYREDVIKVSQAYFQVPSDNPHLTIHRGDGFLFAQQHYYADGKPYDLVLVDAYNHEGMAASVGAQGFFDACSGILSEDGVMSVNLWGSDRPLFHQTMSRINRSFNYQTMVLPVENKGNVIGIATKQEFSVNTLKKLKPYVDQLEQKFAINLPKSLQSMIKQNRNFISRLFA